MRAEETSSALNETGPRRAGAQGILRRRYPEFLAIFVGLASFLFFGVFFRAGIPAIATEFAAAFFGALITVVITMLLLDRQQSMQQKLLQSQAAAQQELMQSQVRAEGERELKAMFLAEKISVYKDLMNEVKSIMARGNIEPTDRVALHMVNQKLALYASKEVLDAFQDFSGTYGRVAEDGEIDDNERGELLRLLAGLSGKMRRDLGIDKHLSPDEEQLIVESVKKNADAISRLTTKEEFLQNCEGEEVAYYSDLFSYLESQKLSPVMGQKGYSIRNRAGRPRIQCYPTNVRKSIAIAYKGRVQAAIQAKVRELLPPEVAVRIKEDQAWIGVKPSELPLDKLKDIVILLTR